MIESSPNKVAFSLSVLAKLRETEAKFRQKHVLWLIPESLLPAMKLMRGMMKRYKSAIRIAKTTKQRPRFQHTIEEAQAEYDVALWTLNQHKRLLGLPEVAELPCELPWLARGLVSR